MSLETTNHFSEKSRDQRLKEMNQLRHEIDDLHHQLFSLIEKRILMTEKIWRLKRTLDLPLNDDERELQLIHLPLQHHSTTQGPSFDAGACEIYQKLTRLLIRENKALLEKRHQMTSLIQE